MTWLAGLFYERMENGFDFFSRIEDYEDTPAFDYWNDVLRRAAGHDGQLLLPLEERPDHGADRRVRRGGLLAERALDALPPGCAGSITRASASISPSSRTAHFVRPVRGRQDDDQRHHQEAVRPVQLQRRHRWCMRCSRTDSAPAAGTSCAPAWCCRPTTSPDFLDNYELGFKSRWAGGRYRLQPHRVQDGVGRLPGRGRRPGPAVRTPSWSPTSATPRSRA